MALFRVAEESHFALQAPGSAASVVDRYGSETGSGTFRFLVVQVSVPELSLDHDLRGREVVDGRRRNQSPVASERSAVRKRRPTGFRLVGYHVPGMFRTMSNEGIRIFQPESPLGENWGGDTLGRKIFDFLNANGSLA